MDIIIEKGKEWNSKKLFKFYSDKNFMKKFIQLFSIDYEVEKYIYAIAFYSKVRYGKKMICEKINEKDLEEIILEEYWQFLDNASSAAEIFTDEPDYLFHFIEYSGICSEIDAALHLRDELLNAMDGNCGWYFHNNDMDEFEDDMKNFITYDSKKHVGSKFNVYCEHIMSNNSAISFFGGSMYLQEVLTSGMEINFDVFYDSFQDFMKYVMENVNIKLNSKATKASFAKDLNKIYKEIHLMNIDTALC